MKYLNDKKAHGVDGLPVTFLKRIGYNKAFHLFSQWTQLKLDKQ